MNEVAWFFLCWGCLALGVLIGHFTWPRPRSRIVLLNSAAASQDPEVQPSRR